VVAEEETARVQDKLDEVESLPHADEEEPHGVHDQVLDRVAKLQIDREILEPEVHVVLQEYVD
jgi:hypothetical protein